MPSQRETRATGSGTFDKIKIIEVTIGHTSWYWCHHPNEPVKAKFSFNRGILFFGKKNIPVGIDLSDPQAQQWLFNVPDRHRKMIRTVKVTDELDMELLRMTPGLQVLECDSVGNERLEEVAYLFKNLKMLYINSSYDMEDFTAFGHIAPLLHLIVTDCENLISLEGIEELKHLVRFEIVNCDNLWGIDPLASAKNLRRLFIRNCENIHSIKAIGVLPKLQMLEISRCKQVTDISPLQGLAAGKKQKMMDILQQNVDREMFRNIKKILQDVPVDNKSGDGKELPAEIQGDKHHAGNKVMDILLQDVNREMFNNIRSILEQSTNGEQTLEGDKIRPQDTLAAGENEEAPQNGFRNNQTLGRHLVQNGYLNEEQLRDALAEAQKRRSGAKHQLRHLNLSDCPRLTDISTLTRLQSLRELYLFGCRNVQNLSPIYDMRNIRKISMPPNVTVDDLTMFCTTSKNHLEELDLRNCNRLNNISPIGELRRLKKLKLSGCSEIQNIDALGKLVELTVLDLADCKKINDLGPLFHLANLRDLYVGGCAGLEMEQLQQFESEKPECRVHYV